jgi:hypothetical protein
MKKNERLTKSQEIAARLKKALPSTKGNLEKINEVKMSSQSDRRKYRALQEALQDSIKIYEGD